MPPSSPRDLGSMRDPDLEDPALRALGEGATAPLKKGHPPGLYLLFVAEMWERFSYYGMKAFLVLYMTAALVQGGLGWTDTQATSLYGTYTALVYLTPVLGGYIADRYLGTHLAMVFGGLIIAAGHFTLAFESIPTFYAGLFLIIIGTGLFKPCASVMVGQLYPERDPRRDAAFTIFYMGVNLGAFLGPLVCGGLRVGQKHGEIFGWSWAFAAAGVGMVLGLICYLIGRPFVLKGVGLPQRKTAVGSTQQPSQPLTREEKSGVIAIFILIFFVIFFWTAYEQSGSSMNLFAERRTDRSMSTELATEIYRWGCENGYPISSWLIAAIGAVLTLAWAAYEYAGRHSERSGILKVISRIIGLAIGPTLFVFGALKAPGFLKEAFFPENFIKDAEYPADWFQSVNPFFILTLAPIFASMWIWLGRKRAEPSTPVKFGLGLILLGIGFICMVLGAQASQAAGPDKIVKVGGYWLVAAYCIHTMGELCLSPVGLSVVNKLAPVKFVSLLMGAWFIANFVANKAAAWLAGKEEWVAKHHIDLGFISLQGHALFFSMFVVFPIAAGIILLCLTKPLNRLMCGRA